jgi:hypothetical protein
MASVALQFIFHRHIPWLRPVSVAPVLDGGKQATSDLPFILHTKVAKGKLYLITIPRERMAI